MQDKIKAIFRVRFQGPKFFNSPPDEITSVSSDSVGILIEIESECFMQDNLMLLVANNLLN